jgi:hypothetical protein
VIEKIAGEGDASASILYKDGKRTATASGQRMSPQFTDVLPRYYCTLWLVRRARKLTEVECRLKGAIFTIFLPVGYPHTVAKEYAEYQVW